MATTITGTTVANADDYYHSDAIKVTGTTTIRAEYNNGTSIVAYAEAEITTSAIPDADTIDSATLHWYNSSYAKTKAASVEGRIQISPDSGSTYYVIYSLATAPSAGWTSHALTTGELAHINKTGKTYFKWIVDDPGSTYYRTWLVGAKEGSTSAYLEVTYSPAPTGKRKAARFILIG